MGEVVKAVKPDYIVQEIALKVQYYNIMRVMTHAYRIVQRTKLEGHCQKLVDFYHSLLYLTENMKYHGIIPLHATAESAIH